MVQKLATTLILILAAWAPPAAAGPDRALTLAIGAPGSDVFTFGTELWAMSQIALAPAYGIGVEAREVAADGDRLAQLRAKQVEAALVRRPVPVADARAMRAIMALWPRGHATDKVEPVQFLVQKDVADDVVYRITKAIFEHAHYMRSAHAMLGIGLPSQAMTGLDVPLHPGAYRYYQEQGFGFDATSPVADRQGEARVFHDFNDAALSAREVEQIAAACRQALDLGWLSAVLGDVSHTGCEAYQRQMVDGGRAKATEADALAAVVAAVQDPSGDGLFDSPVGQGGPAIAAEQGDGAQDASAARRSERWRSIQLQPTM